MPATGADARTRLDAALARMEEAGLENVEGSVGDPDPVVAVMDVWDPMKFDEIIVSTLPTGSSRWLGLDLPHRLEKLTSVPVRHVVSTPRPEVPTGPPPEPPQRFGVLAALGADDEALGGRPEREARLAPLHDVALAARSPQGPSPGPARASRS